MSQWLLPSSSKPRAVCPHCLNVSVAPPFILQTPRRLSPLSQCLSIVFFRTLEGAPQGLLVPQHEVRYFNQQAALSGHQPDLLQLSAQLALSVGQVPQLLQRLMLCVPQAHPVQANLELDEWVPSRGLLEAGDEATLRVLRSEHAAENLGIGQGSAG